MYATPSAADENDALRQCRPDYRVLPKENDYRRTLYWNPALSTDEQGKAYIRFYNNSRCKYPRITVETLTEDGKIGVFRQ